MKVLDDHFTKIKASNGLRWSVAETSGTRARLPHEKRFRTQPPWVQGSPRALAARHVTR